MLVKYIRDSYQSIYKKKESDHRLLSRVSIYMTYGACRRDTYNACACTLRKLFVTPGGPTSFSHVFQKTTYWIPAHQRSKLKWRGYSRVFPIMSLVPTVPALTRNEVFVEFGSQSTWIWHSLLLCPQGLTFWQKLSVRILVSPECQNAWRHSKKTKQDIGSIGFPKASSRVSTKKW